MKDRMATIPAGLLLDEKIRGAFPVLADVVYLNVGTYSLMPDPALAQFQAIQAEFERRGVASDGSFGTKSEETRRRVAALLGADADEISFTRNATDGINLVLAGIDWRPGDEVITTDEEHEAMNFPLLYLCKVRGLVIKRVQVSPLSDVMTQRLEAAVSERTRLVAMSFVSCESGTRLPAQAISAWAARNDVLCLFDGAQVSGAMPVDVREIGCDFYTSNGHKWLSGPKGTGFFYGRLDKLGLLSPAHVGAGSLERVDLATNLAELFLNGQRFEFGTRAWPVQAGLGASLDWFEDLGWPAVYGHIAALSDYLKACILERPFLQLLTPAAFEASSGLTSFAVAGRDAGQVSQALRETRQIYVRVIPHYNALRIATAHFNNVEDIDRLMLALEEICLPAGGPAGQTG
jgi:selenocysteine lyase/cysteine desulfurase